MATILAVALALVAWAISIQRLIGLLRKRTWRMDKAAVRIWLTTFLFAILLTLLEVPVSDWIDGYTWPNFSRFIAYLCVPLILHIIITVLLTNLPAMQVTRYQVFLNYLLIITLSLLNGIYWIFVSKTPGWQVVPVPVTVPQLVFQLVPFAYAIVGSIVLLLLCWFMLRNESVRMMRYRVVVGLITTIFSGAYFTLKSVFALGFFWPWLQTDLIHQLTTILEAGTVLLWGGVFVNNLVYTRLYSLVQSLKNWMTYRDLSYLVSRLDRFCPAVGMGFEPVPIWRFLQHADYCLYQALLHILDCRVMLAAETNEIGDRMDVDRLRAALIGVNPGDDFLDMISTYRQVGRLLRSQS